MKFFDSHPLVKEFAISAAISAAFEAGVMIIGRIMDKAGYEDPAERIAREKMRLYADAVQKEVMEVIAKYGVEWQTNEDAVKEYDIYIKALFSMMK